jgi:integrase
MGNKRDRNDNELVGDLVRIFQRGRKWYANFQLGGRQCRKALRTASRKEARRRAIQLEAQLLRGTYQHVPLPAALSKVVVAYLDFLRTEGRARKTLVKYEQVLQRALDLAGRRRVSSVQEVGLGFLDAFRAERVQAGAAPKTVYTETVVLRQLVNFALSRGLAARDPLRGLRLKKPRPAPQPCWTPAEVEKILAASRESDRAKFLVLALTGLRVGELRHLTWDDIDWQRNLLRVREKPGWKPKTGDQRAVPMSARVRAVLAGLPRRCRWVFPAAPSAKYSQGDHQFSDRHLLFRLKRVLGRLGLPGHVHTFRHAFISRALTEGIPVAIVRQWVGHVDAEVIKLYTHIADPSSQAAMQRLEGAVNNEPAAGSEAKGSKCHEGKSAQIQHNRRGQRNGPNAT